MFAIVMSAFSLQALFGFELMVVLNIIFFVCPAGLDALHIQGGEGQDAVPPRGAVPFARAVLVDCSSLPKEG
jgi:hypothetical protein